MENYITPELELVSIAAVDMLTVSIEYDDNELMEDSFVSV